MKFYIFRILVFDSTKNDNNPTVYEINIPLIGHIKKPKQIIENEVRQQFLQVHPEWDKPGVEIEAMFTNRILVSPTQD